MLPLGLINLVVVAVIEQFKLLYLEKQLGVLAASWAMVLPAAIISLGAWFLLAVLSNRASRYHHASSILAPSGCPALGVPFRCVPTIQPSIGFPNLS
jgi:hypothetical protein